MKFLVAATFPAFVAGYSMGGYGRFGSAGGPRVVINRNGCTPSSGGPRRQIDRDFENLQAEMNRPPSSDQIRQQQEWVSRAFGLAAEVANALSSEQVQNNEESARQQKEWLNRAFGIASDVASGYSSPRYEIRRDDNELFEVALDVPGVKASDIDIRVEPEGKTNVMIVSGERSDVVGPENGPRNFAKSFRLDPNVDTESIIAELTNGVLIVSATKRMEKDQPGKKIPVRQVSE
jgi:HSP20 family molecular chaperone IbpA